MTEKLKRVKKDISKKPITIMLLLVMLVFSLVALSFAWYRNYVDIKGTTLTSGKISLEIDGYGVDGQGSVTAVTPIIINGQTESSVVVDSTVTKIDTWNKEYHVYYFIKNPKTDTSFPYLSFLYFILHLIYYVISQGCKFNKYKKRNKTVFILFLNNHINCLHYLYL